MRDCESSDLALELLGGDAAGGDGVRVEEAQAGELFLHTLSILDERGAKKLGKPVGRYLTMQFPKLSHMGDDVRHSLVSRLAAELRRGAENLTGRAVDGDFSLFVVGLGNASLTADAIGPLVVERLCATRHLGEREPELYRRLGCASLACLSPGVLGQTGVESAELILGAVREIRPHLLLVVDALAARECDHLFSALQVSDAGIEPGSGVGNHRSALTFSTMGIPVISVGVPTVVNSARLVREALENAGIAENDRLSETLSNRKSFFVSPKDSDFQVKEAASLIATGIKEAFTPGL